MSFNPHDDRYDFFGKKVSIGSRGVKIYDRKWQLFIITDIKKNRFGKACYVLDLYSKNFESQYYIGKSEMSIYHSDKLILLS